MQTFFSCIAIGRESEPASTLNTDWKTDSTRTAETDRITMPVSFGDIYNYMVDRGDGNTNPEALSVISFTLVNGDTDEDLFEPTDGMQIDMNILPTTNLDIGLIQRRM